MSSSIRCGQHFWQSDLRTAITMRWFTATIQTLFLIAWCHLAVGQVPMTGAGVGAPSSGGAAPTFTNIQSGVSGVATCSFATTCSVSGLTVASGFNIVGVAGRQNSGTADWSAVSLCGTPLSLIKSNGNAAGFATDLWGGTVTGGTCAVTATSGGGAGIISLLVGLGLLSHLTSTTATSTCLYNVALPFREPTELHICDNVYGSRVSPLQWPILTLPAPAVR